MGTWNTIDQSQAKAPVDAQDALYKAHDIGYGQVRDMKPYWPDDEAAGFKDQDRTLGKNLGELGEDPSNNFHAKLAHIFFSYISHPGAEPPPFDDSWFVKLSTETQKMW